MTDKEQLKATLAELRKPFRPEEHEERKLPGGGKWFYIPWQLIRDRVEAVAPDYELEFYDPQFVGHLCTIRCRMTISGVTRIELGNAETDKSGGRGTPVECAKADAYKNAAESFGVAAYLDDQSAGKREFTAQYLQSKGDGRAAKFAKENDWQRHGLPAATASETRKPAAAKPAAAKPTPQKPPDIAPADPNCITREQQKRLFAIGTESGYTKEGLKLLVKINGFDSSASITRVIYRDICEAAGDPSQAAHWNAEAIGTWEQTA